MGADETFCNLDMGDLQDLVFDDTEKGPSSYNAGWLGELCVPTDPIEDLEWFPSFRDDFISLNDMGFMQQQRQGENQLLSLVDYYSPLTPEQRQEAAKARQNRRSTRKDDEVETLLSRGSAGFTTKKARKRNYRKPKPSAAWVKKRCSHCEADETPQWRNGPSGPKTLCNACGVRYKSGRLVPEYRPATSPTFDAAKHSNYHKKILKRRSTE